MHPPREQVEEGPQEVEVLPGHVGHLEDRADPVGGGKWNQEMINAWLAQTLGKAERNVAGSTQVVGNGGEWLAATGHLPFS